MDIYEALEKAATMRATAEALNREADELETEWVGAASGDVLTVARLVEVIRKVGQANATPRKGPVLG
jgi:hypothetical protein